MRTDIPRPTDRGSGRLALWFPLLPASPAGRSGHGLARRLTLWPVILVVTTLAALLAPIAVGPATAQEASMRIDGRGMGPGRGMGQYGAFGYAVDFGWDHQRILNHYYGNTTAGDIGNPLMTVRMSLLNAGGGTTGTDYPESIVYLRNGTPRVFDAAGNPVATGGKAVQITRAGDGLFRVSDGPGCSGPWTERARVTGTRVRVAPQAHTGTVDDALALCQGATDARWVQGEILTVDSGGRSATINLIAMQDYLRGVVPRESPASWADAGGGRGINALRAQAVAARSYAMAEDRGPNAKTCDTISCQVYVGLFTRVGGVERSGNDPRTDRAIAETAGEVRMRGGRVQRTEFSSSSGGHTAGGTFPAVVDDGDATRSNPNHRWQVDLPLSRIEGHYGMGTLRSAGVIARDGVGPDGGRATRVRLEFANGTVEAPAIDFRRAFALKSEWFYFLYSSSVPPPPPPPLPPTRSIDAACAGAPSGGFGDVSPGSVHAAAIDCLAALGVALGRTDGTYGPGAGVTRAQMASFLDRLLARSDTPLPRGEDRFGDDDGSPHEDSINALAAAGIAAGRTPNAFVPDERVTRAQMATFLVRTAEHALGRALPPAAADYFTDDAGLVHTAAIGASAEAGLAAGTGAGRYDPAGGVERAQMATFLARLASLLTDADVFRPVS